MLEGVVQVTQYLGEVRADLHQLVRLAEAQEDALVQLQILSDIRYSTVCMPYKKDLYLGDRIDSTPCRASCVEPGRLEE